MSDTFAFGDYVLCADHEYKGRITKTYSKCPQSKTWLANLEKAIEPYELDVQWIDVLCHKGGLIVTPITRMKKIEPFDFVNDYAKHHFENINIPVLSSEDFEEKELYDIEEVKLTETDLEDIRRGINGEGFPYWFHEFGGQNENLNSLIGDKIEAFQQAFDDLRSAAKELKLIGDEEDESDDETEDEADDEDSNFDPHVEQDSNCIAPFICPDCKSKVIYQIITGTCGSCDIDRCIQCREKSLFCNDCKEIN